MNKASDEFGQYLTGIHFNHAEMPIILNRTGEQELNGEKLRENLPLQVKSSVKWSQTVVNLADKVEGFLECGPGRVLTGLIRKTLDNPRLYNVFDAASLDLFISEYEKGAVG